MKKKNLKALKLNKKVVSNFNQLNGGNIVSMPDNSGSRWCVDTEQCGSNGDGGSINIPTIDIPTFNDSCFSLCNDKCNDF